ncbi:MAG: MFS transporter [Desulfobulbaceae bacterium]|nr:MFS transporter [Desulfobulbaceae bacterium]HIJ77891.1 MFS transporter [Deltaproteobacteria bacterium]
MILKDQDTAGSFSSGGYLNRQILLSVAIRFLLYFVHWMVLAYLPVVLKGYGVSDLQVGSVIGFFALSSMALMLPLGLFSDFFSPKRTMMSGALLYGIYFAALLKVRTFGLLLPVLFLGGVGSAALIVVSESLYLKHFGNIERGRRVAFYQLSTYLGFGLGPLVGGLVVEQRPSLLFGLALLGTLLIFGLAFFLDDYEPIVFSFKKYGEDVAGFKPLLLIACVFVLGTHFGVEQTSFSLLLQEKLGFAPRMIGLVFAGLGLWMALTVPFIGRLHDKRQSVFLFFLVGLGVSGFFQVMTAWAFDFWSLLIIRLLHTLGDAVALLELGVLVALLFPAQRLGGNSGLVYGVRTLATFMAAVFAGVLNGQWGYGASFVGSGLFVMLFVAVSIIFIVLSRDRMGAVGWNRS